jgi:outer membrane protein assembly factor BamB
MPTEFFVRLPGHYRVILASLLLCSVLSYSGQKTSSALPPVSDFATLPLLKWEFPTTAPIYASPIVVGSRVYIGGLDSLLHAIDIGTGKELWHFRTGGEIRSNICADSGWIYLNGGDGVIYALDGLSGTILWKFETAGEKKYDFADYFHSTPVLHDGALYVGSGDGNIYAIHAGSGRLIWKGTTGGIVHTTGVISGDVICFGSFDGNVYAFNTANGELAWKFKTVGHRYFPAGEVQGSPAQSGGLLFIGARDYNVYALDAEKGFCHWNKAFERGWGLAMTVHDSVLYIGSSDERVLMAVDPATGVPRWKKQMEFLVFGNTAFSERMLYVGSTIGKLHGISLETGEKVWSYGTESYLSNRSKYFKPDDSYRDDIYSIITSNEHFLQVECELGGIFSTPAITQEHLFFSSTNGKLYCLGR